ncbi:MAG: hypothetical protein ABIZ80_03900 [Bryobacteraceae bacterium]
MFSAAECVAVRDWVRAGGALLLIADHAPFGDSAAVLAQRFGIDMGRGFAADRKNSGEEPTLLIFWVENGLLGDHPIVRGVTARSACELSSELRANRWAYQKTGLR